MEYSAAPIFFDEQLQQGFFDELSQSYDWAEWFSLGFLAHWRSQAIELLSPATGSHICDLMCGTGSALPLLAKSVGHHGHIVAIDYSSAMLARAAKKTEVIGSITLRRANARKLPFANDSMDSVFCAYGTKTMSPAQLTEMAREIFRVLKPGGRFVFVEATLPCRKPIRAIAAFYLRRIVPVIASALSPYGGAHRMLCQYLETGSKARHLIRAIGNAKLRVLRVKSSRIGFAYTILGGK